MNLKQICIDIEEIASEAGRFIMHESERFDIGSTEMKGLNDFVTYVDRGAEKLLVERLGKLIPSAGFLVEENTSTARGEKYCWVVDPLDGTTNFIHRIYPFALSIALTENDETIAGVVFEASGKETFTAWKGGGAWLNGKRIHVSSVSSSSRSFIATGFPYKDFSRLTQYLECLNFLLKNTTGVRRMGSASIDLSYVACGRFDLFFEYGLNPWDIAAGRLLVKEAGGIISDFSGRQENVTGAEIIGANASVYQELLKIISNFMLK